MTMGIGVTKPLLLGLATGLAAIAVVLPEAQAASCAGFTDVDDGSAFCPNVEWLKNRSITLGCGAGSYCAGDSLTRLAAAAFLNRMSIALTPGYIVAGDIASGDLSDSSIRTCVSDEHPAADFPRIAVADGSVTAFDSATDQVLGANVTYSTDGGNVWNFPFGVPGSARARNAPAHDRATIPLISHPIPLAAGVPYRFSVLVSGVRNAGFVSVLCGLRVRIENANPVSSPFDGSGLPVMQGR